MRNALLTVVIAATIAVPAAAAPPVGYMGLYVDAGHAGCSVSYGGGPTQFEVWAWCLPSVNGMNCAEFTIGYPAHAIPSNVTLNPLIQGVGCWEPWGYQCCFASCQTDWTWIARVACLLTSGDPGFVTLLPHPSHSMVQFANCMEGYPVEPAAILNHLALNHACVLAVQETSWGAIKNLYR